jgi:hypothetical protein
MELDLYRTNYNRTYKIIRYSGLIGLLVFFLVLTPLMFLNAPSESLSNLAFIVAIICLFVFISSNIIIKIVKGGMGKTGTLVFSETGFQIQLLDEPPREFKIRNLPRFRMKLTDYKGEVDVSLQFNFSRNKGIENYIWIDWEDKKRYYRIKVPTESAYNKLIGIGRNWEQKVKSIRIEY